MHRNYLAAIQTHLSQYRQMLFLTGPRQVGKTTLAQQCAKHYDTFYLNWDSLPHKALILEGIEKIYAEAFGDIAPTQPRVIIFDEIHKFPTWKTLLKGYFDTYGDKTHFIVTGSAKLDTYRHGSDSMMGRYFLYRIHPLSVAECADTAISHPTLKEILLPKDIGQQIWETLFTFGGFPEPFFTAESSFYQRWQNLRESQLFNEDLRELTKIHDLSRLQMLAQLLTEQVGGTIQYSNLAKKVRVSEPTIRHWMDVLSSVYHSFTLTPWSNNVARSLLKEPKAYLWDWSMVREKGARIENMVASHLLKATHWWTDNGLGKYQLHYLRDKEKREVDFLICRNNQPWIMVEVKTSSNKHVSPALTYFHEQLKPEHAFQIAYDLPYQEMDCFSVDAPMIVPMRTFLSQLA